MGGGGGGGGGVEMNRNLSKQPFSTGSGRKTLKNSLRDYFHLLKSPDFRLLVLKCAGSTDTALRMQKNDMTSLNA